MTKWQFSAESSRYTSFSLDASSDDYTGAVSGTLRVDFKDFAVSGFWGWSPDRRNKDAAITLLGTCTDEETIFVTLSGVVNVVRDDFNSIDCVIALSFTNEDDRSIWSEMEDRDDFDKRDWTPLVQLFKRHMYAKP